ncbi:hypothetical protein CRG98_022326 [Punica granatum]|uniref:Integrase catalytic domain-containing protein n=1 Tax=Punica granatum TaxID=22663 RepID=A0A2I0JM04_PUNGR|nr:hypothetical protein CRG98_022326 [Punica granatum]
MEEINVGTENEPHTLKIGTGLDLTQRARMIDFLTRYQEVFAWSYADMPSLDPSIVKHFLPLDTERFSPKRQQLRRQRAGLLFRIKEEVVKHINAGFLEVCNYSEWVANIVPMEKKDGRVRVCVDYRDLNKASPKDNFSLPHIDVLVDNTVRHSQFSFMDGFSGYNQIRMAEEDKIKTTFTTMWGTFCYRVMPFGLKNAGATYQRAMLRLNPAKCTFGARSGKLLGFVVSERGIEVDPDKVKAIRELPQPLSVRERLRQYTLYHTIRLLSKADPLKYLVDSPSSMRNIAKWRCQLTEYDIEYVSCTSVKGQAIADHLAKFPIEDSAPINPDFPDEGILQVDGEEEKSEWKMYFDGAVNSTGSGISAVLISPDRRYYPVAVQIDFPCTNNVAEYEACILGLQVAGQWKTKDAKLVPYHEYLERLTENFEDISFTYTPRMKNQFADALATLASMVSITRENLIKPLEIEIAKGPAHCNAIEASEAKPWYEDIKNFLRIGQYPPFADRRDRKMLRRLAIHYFLSGEILYHRSFDSTLLRFYADQIKAPPNELCPMTAPWPFSMWGMDVIGPINPKASNGHMFILVAIDCFTKWIEAITFASVTTKAVARFLKRDVIARYGVPATIITDNAKNLNNKVINELYAQFKIQHCNSTLYRPQMNGAVEGANKNIKKIIEKMTVNYKDWHEMLPYALLAYRTSIRTSTGATPYSLVSFSPRAGAVGNPKGHLLSDGRAIGSCSRHISAVHGLRPSNLLLSTGLGLAFYHFPRASAWHSTAFHGFRPGILRLSIDLGLESYCFPRASAWQFTAFHGPRPGILLLSMGFDLAFYGFPRASAWHLTASHRLRPSNLLLSTGLGLAYYCFPRASAWHVTAFHGPRPGILLLSTGFGLAYYCFPRASAWHLTAFHGFRPGILLLSTGFGLVI